MKIVKCFIKKIIKKYIPLYIYNIYNINNKSFHHYFRKKFIYSKKSNLINKNLYKCIYKINT